MLLPSPSLPDGTLPLSTASCMCIMLRHLPDLLLDLQPPLPAFSLPLLACCLGPALLFDAVNLSRALSSWSSSCNSSRSHLLSSFSCFFLLVRFRIFRSHLALIVVALLRGNSNLTLPFPFAIIVLPLSIVCCVRTSTCRSGGARELCWIVVDWYYFIQIFYLKTCIPIGPFRPLSSLFFRDPESLSEGIIPPFISL